MAKKISQLTDLTTLTGEEHIPAVISGFTFKFKIKDIRSLITKADVGLGNVDNTSDLAKPISIATQSALNSKANLHHSHAVDSVSGLQELLDQKANSPHVHNVNNIEGLDVALSNKADVSHSHTKEHVSGLTTDLDNINAGLNNKANILHGHNTADIAGLDLMLSAKASIGHSHLTDDITGLETFVRDIIGTDPGNGFVTIGSLEW